MDIIVKETELADAFQLSNIAKETFALACPHESDEGELIAFCEKNLSTPVFEKLICAQNSYVAHACLNNEIAGFVVLIFGSTCTEFQDLKKPVELHKFYLKQKYHGKEVSKILMNDALIECKKKSYENVWLSVFSGNQRAIGFYSNFGFVIVGQTNFLMGSETHLDNLMVANIA